MAKQNLFGQDGKNHKGIIDPVYSADYVRDFPNAMGILTLVSPVKYRNEMFDSFIEMLNLGLIEFTEDYDMKGYLMLPTEKNGEITYKKRNLSFEEELALKNIDFGKEQGILMSRYESVGTGNYRYDLPPDKRRTMHDDHFFTLALLGWHLKNVRHKDKMSVKKEKNDLNKLLLFKNPKMRNRRNGLFYQKRGDDDKMEDDKKINMTQEQYEEFKQNYQNKIIEFAKKLESTLANNEIIAQKKKLFSTKFTQDNINKYLENPQNYVPKVLSYYNEYSR